MRIKYIYNITVTLFLVNAAIYCFPQGEEANIWYFGEYAGLDFSNGFPIALTNGSLNTLEGCSSISTSNGELLFYTDGQDVWQNNHIIMPNGSGLMGHKSSTQSAIIVPNPGNHDLYYIFTVDATENNLSNGLRYSLVDMSLNGGMGDVVDSEKNILLVAPTCEKISAVGNKSGNGTWVTTHLWGTNIFHSYIVNQFGVSSTPVVSQIGTIITGNQVYAKGYLKISPDGTWIAKANNTLQTIEIFNFNNETGEVSNPISDNRFYWDEQPYGIEFSPNSSLLYISNWYTAPYIYQYDLTAGSSQEILNSRMLIVQSVIELGALQLGPDNRIYIAQRDYGSLSVISSPNIYGLGCNYILNDVSLSGRKSNWGLPPFIQSFFNLSVGFYCDTACYGTPTQFYSNISETPDSVLWNFGDTASGQFNTSTQLDPQHLFTTPGVFDVTLIAFMSGQSEESSDSVTVNNLPEPNLGNDTLFCNTSFSITLNANCEGDVFAWSTGQFGTPEITVSDTGLYVVIVSKNGCSNSDSIYIGLYPQMEVDSSSLVIIPASCGIANGSITGLQVNGTEPLLYFWLDITGDTVGFDLDIDNLNAGIYTLHVSDGNGCANNIGSYIVTDDGMMQVDSVQHTNDHCSQLGATIQVFAQEIGTGTISYSIDGGITYLQNDGVFTDLSAGTYNVIIKDENNCEGIYQNNPVVIQNIPGPEVTSVIVLPEEDYGQNGQIDMQAIVSWGNAFYSIDNGLNFQQGNGLFINLSAGTYICVVQDAFGCDTTFQIIVDHIVTTPLEAIAGNGTTCIGNAVVSPLQLNYFNEVKSFQVKLTYDFDLVKCDGYINLNPEFEQGFSANIIPDIGEIYLFWEGESPLSLPEYAVMTELVFSALLDGNSAVNWETGPGESEFLDQYGQQLNVEYHTGNLRIYTRPEIEMVTEQEICVGETISIHPLVEGGSGAKTYIWSGPGGFQSSDSILSLSNIQADQQGLYTLQVYDTLQCDDASSFQLFVHPLPEIAFAPYDTLYVEPGYELHAGNGYRDYLWNNGEQTESIIVDSCGEYGVQVTSYDDCVATETIQIRWSAISIYLPNAFTPDGDGLNDVFVPVVRYDFVATYHMYIFNRWGQMIFESSDMQQGWDGTYKGKQAMGGVYVYRIDYSVSGSQSQKSKTLTGNVVLVR
jgi:gliding motility-associated-like protein